MAFKIDDLIVDRILMAVAENSNNELLYTLNNVSSGELSVTSESTDVNDAQGNLVKRFYTGKTGTFTATNAFLNLSVLGAQTGKGKVQATDTATIVMPKVIKVKAGETAVLKDYVDGTVVVNALENNVVGEAYTLSTSASTTEFAIDSTNGTFTPPAAVGVTSYLVKYDRTVKSGVAIKNTTTDFPKAIQLTLKVICADPCQKEGVRVAYIVMPNFQVSPDVTINISRDNQNIDYTGQLAVDYCSEDKELYSIYIAEDDTDENA